MFDLTGKTALVTGASGGIGGAIAKCLAAQGANLVVTGTKEAALQQLVADIAVKADQKIAIVPANLGDAAEADRLFREAEAVTGAIDILVNNAGLTRDNIAMRLKDEDWESVMNVNLTAAFRLSRAAMRGMMKRRWGRLIGITSVVGVTGNGGQANYAASKAGMIGMMKSFAQELASRNITANCVAPGFIATAMTEVLDAQQQEKISASIPAGKMGTSDDIAAAVLYLASEEANYVTGQTLHVNGGMAMI